MQIIGLYLMKETSKKIRKSLLPGWYPIIESKYVSEIVPPEVAPVYEDFFNIQQERLKINISAIAGKNGKGKSTLSELILQCLNNFCAYHVMQNDIDGTSNFLSYVLGIYAILYYKLDGKIYQLTVKNKDISLKFYRGEQCINVGLKTKQLFSNHLFYTLAVNYGIHSYIPDNVKSFTTKLKEQEEQSPDSKTPTGKYSYWFERFFHRTDGYSIPLSLIPDRIDGGIDINNENILANQRLTSIALYLHIITAPSSFLRL